MVQKILGKSDISKLLHVPPPDGTYYSYLEIRVIDAPAECHAITLLWHMPWLGWRAQHDEKLAMLLIGVGSSLLLLLFKVYSRSKQCPNENYERERSAILVALLIAAFHPNESHHDEETPSLRREICL